MAVIDSQIRTISCNGCDKTITFDRREEQKTFDTPGNEWLKCVRLVQAVDGRNFSYCSDVCEIKGAESGTHNLPQPKKVIDAPATPAAIAAAAAAAKQAEAASAALKAGSPVTLS